MERRTLLFIVLSLGIWYAWLLINPPEPDPETPATTEPADPTQPAEPSPTAPVSTPTAAPAAPVGPERVESFDSCGTHESWSSRGGGFRDIVLPEYSAPYEVTPIYTWALGGFGEWKPYGDDPGPARVLTEKGLAFAAGYGEVTSAPLELSGGPGSASGERGGMKVEQRMLPRPAADGRVCTAEVTYTWTNTGTEPFAGEVWLAAHDTLPEGGGGMLARYTSTQSATALVDGEVWTFYEYEELTAPERIEGPAGWFGIGDRYFAAYMVPEVAHGQIAQTRLQTPDGVRDGMHWLIPVDLQPGASHVETLSLYIGPKDLDALNTVHEDLGLAVELGWFSFFARPLLWMLKLFYYAVGNWGLAIVLLTFTVKIVFFPLTQSAFKSGQAMSAIQPMLKEIREEFADNQEELNRRTMELFKEHKVNPLGGCLPMLVQFPVWIALYNVLLSSVELYQTEFLYLKDLSSVDPYGVLPIIVVGLIMLQQQFTPTAANMDPAQARMMKLMPLMFGIFFFTFPSGLVVYIFVNTVLSVLQQWFIKRTYAGPKPPEGAEPAK